MTNSSYYAYMYIHIYPSKVVVIHSKSTSSGLDNPWIPAGTLLWAPPALVQSMRISNENMLLVQVSLGFCSNSSTISQELYRFLSFQGSKKGIYQNLMRTATCSIAFRVATEDPSIEPCPATRNQAIACESSSTF